MSLANLLELSSSKDSQKQGLSEERLKAQLPYLRNMVSFFREYPDLLVDSMSGFAEAQENGTLSEYKGFRFYFYQSSCNYYEFRCNFQIHFFHFIKIIKILICNFIYLNIIYAHLIFSY